MATALLRGTVRLLMAMATRRSPVTATLHRNRATRLPVSGSRRRASRATRSCHRGRRRGRLRATVVRRLTLLIRSKAVATAATAAKRRRTSSKAVKRRRIHLTLSSKRRRKGTRRLIRLTLNNKRHRNNTGHRRPRAVLLRATEARRLINTAVRLLRATVRLRSRDNLTGLRPRGNRTARHRQLLRRHTTARPPTQPAPTARRLDPRDRRIEFAETYRDTL